MTDYKNPNLIIETAKVEPGEIVWRSPSNLAIVKYWGKYGRQLPKNPSLSLTLSSSFTDMLLAYKPKETGDQNISLDFSFHGEPNEQFKKKVKDFIESVTDIFPFLRQLDLNIKTGNSFPHSVGIASSASAMSALALCLCSLEHELFESLDDDTEFDRKSSFVARLGSGSACRSIFPTAALWGEVGTIPESSNLYALPMADRVHEVFKDLHDDILIASTEAKSVSSRTGHSLMDQHPFAEARYADAKKNLINLLSIMSAGDLEAFGRIAENEALTLHALMMSSSPAYILMKPNTLEMIERIRRYREETKHPVYFSLDAGPNLHVLYPGDIIHEVRVLIDDQLTPLCEEKQYLGDWVGEGPVQV